MSEQTAYFMTVEWCNNSHRGIFCDEDGLAYSKEDGPHTTLEMHKMLGAFWMILKPRSELMTESDVAAHDRWAPLAEYSDRYGIACRAQVAEDLRNLAEQQAEDIAGLHGTQACALPG